MFNISELEEEAIRSAAHWLEDRLEENEEACSIARGITRVMDGMRERWNEEVAQEAAAREREEEQRLEIEKLNERVRTL